MFTTNRRLSIIKCFGPRFVGKTIARAAVCFVILLISGCSTPPTSVPEKPNILLILADDVGCDALGCYGGASYQTPRLDELASSGMQFRHCYSMPVCHPSRISFLTGRHDFRHGHPAWGTFPGQAESQTFAHALKRAGYTTAISGKWQLTLMRDEPDHPHRLGFDQYALFGWHEGPRYYQPMIYQNGTVRRDTEDRYGPDVYVEFLIDFMARNQDRPFLAFYSMTLAHDVTDDLEKPVPHGPHGRYDTYKEMVEGMDERVGRLVDAVARLGLREKTLVLYTTDNGTPKRYIHSATDSGDLIREPVISRVGEREVAGGKGELTDAGTNVPLIANWPQIISPGQVVDDLVDFSDFFPTLLELAGTELPVLSTIDGISFAGRLQGGSPSPRPWAFSEHNGKFWVRTQRWKLYDDGRFFDLHSDAIETYPIPVSNQPRQAATVRRQLSEVVAMLRHEHDTN